MNFRKLSLFALTLIAGLTANGQRKLSPYTLHSIHRQEAGTTRTVEGSDRMVSAYLHTVGTPDVAALEQLGVEVNLRLDGILTARLPLSVVPVLEQFDFIRYVQLGTPVRPQLDSARVSAGVNLVQSGEGLDLPYTGKGVVVGVIDGGFDYTHPAFRDSEGHLRIKRVWEQCHSEGTPPAGFSYGSEFADEETILSAQGDVATNSHGSHVLNIAAGAANVETPYYGVAPEADIVLVSNRYASGDEQVLLTADNVNISDAIAYIYGYAESVGKPCVINMSLGNHLGPHDGTSAFDQVADKQQGNGRLLVGSVGNNGNDAVHASKTFTGEDDAAMQVRMSYKINPTTAVGGEVEIWGEPGMSFDLRVIAVKTVDLSEDASSETFTVGGDAEGISSEVAFTKSTAKGSVLVTTEVNPLNGKPHALLSFEMTRLNGRAMSLLITPRSAGTVHAWADGTYMTFEQSVAEGWTGGDTSLTLTEIGGTGTQIISVGAYVTRNSYKAEGSTREEVLENETLGARATFSSAGPTVDGRMKPDIMAPGTYIASAISSHDQYSSSYPTAQTVTYGEKSYTYGYMQGTSMAAPFVTGVLATWLQADPTLTPESVRTVLAKTAVNDTYTDGSTCGYGKVAAYEGLKEVIATLASVEETVADGTQGVLLSRPSAEQLCLLFTRSASGVEAVVYDALGHRLFTHSVGTVEPGMEQTLSLHSLPHGIYLLHVNGETFKVVK